MAAGGRLDCPLAARPPDGPAGNGYNRANPGAAEAIAALRGRGYRLRFVTNTTNKRRETIQKKLETLGIEAEPSAIFTVSFAASLMLRGHPEARCWVITWGDAIHEFQGLRLDQDRPDFVVLGDLMEGLTFELPNRIFRRLIAGAELIALQKNRYWLTRGGTHAGDGTRCGRTGVCHRAARHAAKPDVSYLQ